MRRGREERSLSYTGKDGGEGKLGRRAFRRETEGCGGLLQKPPPPAPPKTFGVKGGRRNVFPTGEVERYSERVVNLRIPYPLCSPKTSLRL